MTKQTYFLRRYLGRFGELLISLCSIAAHSLCLLDFRAPDYVRDIDAKAKDSTPNTDFQKELDNRLEAAWADVELETPTIFVIGEWGSGKTFQLLSYKNEASKNGRHMEYFSFWGIQSVKEGLLHTIPVVQRVKVFVFCVLSTLAVFYFAPSNLRSFTSISQISELMLAIFLVLLSLVIIPGKWKAFYTITAALTAPVFGVRRVILDDLERSGLGYNDQWRLLLSLWKYNVHYIIPLGHGISDSTYNWRSSVAKLNGTIIHLPTPSHVKLSLLNGKLSPALFTRGVGWLDYLTPRDIVSIADHWHYLLGNQPVFIQTAIGFKLVLDRLMDKIGLNTEDRPRILLYDHGTMGGLKVDAQKNVFEEVRKHRIEAILNSLIRSLETNFSSELKLYLGSSNTFSQTLMSSSPEEIARIQQISKDGFSVDSV